MVSGLEETSEVYLEDGFLIPPFSHELSHSKNSHFSHPLLLHAFLAEPKQ